MAQQKKVTIAGVEYTLQKLPPREYTRLRARSSDRSGLLNEERYLDEVLEHIVVDPKVKLDDFEDYAAVEEVVAEATNFQHGRRVI